MNRLLSYFSYISSLAMAFAPRFATTLPGTAEMSARKAAAVFLQALNANDMQDMLRVIDAPFLTREQQVLRSKDEVLHYLSRLPADRHFSDTLLGVLPYPNSRDITDKAVLSIRDQMLNASDFLVGTGRGNVMHSYLLVKSGIIESKVVGIGQ